MVRRADLRPYVRRVQRYIQANASHPGITAALDWLHTFIYAAPQGPAFPSRRATGEQRLNRWLNRIANSGVHLDEALAVIVAMYLYREMNPRAFVSDAHFRAMLAHHFCRLAPAPFMQTYRGGTGAKRYDRIGASLRKALRQQIEQSVGVVALLMARALTPNNTHRTEPQ
jgi:hypothetical protein